MSGLYIDYESEDFPPAILPNGRRRLHVVWDDILWAAITVGRPDIYHVFRYGMASVYEAILRWSMVRMALEQRGPRGRKLVRTDLFKRMDPTEKGAVNYFLGLLVCKLFASKLLNAPWSLHLDVFRPMLGVRLIGGRSRPDMVAQSALTSQWHAFECKGRASAPGSVEKQRAKAQALRLISVNGTSCSLHVGAISFFKNETIEFYWRDPDASAREAIEIPDPDFGWRIYYEPFVEVVRSRGQFAESVSTPRVLAQVQELDLQIGIHPAIASHLLASDWVGARTAAREARDEFAASGFQPDGLLIKAGRSWTERFETLEGA